MKQITRSNKQPNLLLKLQEAFFSHRYFFAVFLYLLFYSYFVSGQMNAWTVDSAVQALYGLDFSFGFLSRILPGAIYMFFFHKVESKTVAVYSAVLLILFFAILSLFCEKILKKCSNKKEITICVILLMLFLTGPFTFAVYVQGLGISEVYWLFCTVLFFFFLEHRALYPFIIPLCLIVLLFNYSAIICYIPFYCILILYKISISNKTKDKTILYFVFALSAAASIILFLYFTSTLDTNVKYTLPEFEKKLSERGATDNEYASVYFFTSFHKDLEFVPDSIDSPFWKNFSEKFPALWVFIIPFFHMLREGFNVFYYLDLIILLAPILFFVLRFFIQCIKNKTNNKLRRFVYFCVPVLFFVTVIFSFLISIDRLKWVSCAFIPLFSSILYLFYHEEKNSITEYLSRVFFTGSGKISPFVISFCIVYAFTIYGQYH